MNLSKREQKILKSLEKNEAPYDIPVILDGIDELVYKHDPHSREESRLNLVIEDYLFEEAENAPLRAPLNIRIQFDQKKDGDLETAEKIIRNNFKRILHHEVLLKKREMRKWRLNLVTGTLFLAACLIMNQILGMREQTALVNFLKESFGIIGWVAIWEPAAYFLYGWREGSARFNFAIRLKNANVTVEQTVPHGRSQGDTIASV